MSPQLSASAPNPQFHISSSGSHIPALFCAEILLLLLWGEEMVCLPAPFPGDRRRGCGCSQRRGLWLPLKLLEVCPHSSLYFLPPPRATWALLPSFKESIFACAAAKGKVYTTQKFFPTVLYGAAGPAPSSSVRSIKGMDQEALPPTAGLSTHIFRSHGYQRAFCVLLTCPVLMAQRSLLCPSGVFLRRAFRSEAQCCRGRSTARSTRISAL